MISLIVCHVVVSICAGDYGDSGYHGFNEIIVHGGYITASVAKLNDYYLSTVTATENRKQYTMCHGKCFGV